MINQRLTEAEQNLKLLQERNQGRPLPAAEGLSFIQTQAMLALAIELNRFNNIFEDRTKIGGSLDTRSLYKR